MTEGLLEILKFIFQDLPHFIGFLVLIALIGVIIENISENISRAITSAFYYKYRKNNSEKIVED